jgi:hypothetical protein
MNQYSSHIITGDRSQTNRIINQLFDDNEREVPIEKLRLPKTLPMFKLRDILFLANQIDEGLIKEQLVVNKELMITDDYCKYFALKRIGRHKVKICFVESSKSVDENLFSLRK